MHRERFDQLRDQVRSANDGRGLPEALLHGNVLHVPDRTIIGKPAPGDQLEGIRARPAHRRLRLPDVGHLAQR